MIRIAVVEDQVREQEHLVQCLKELGQQENLVIDIRTFSSGDAFLFNYHSDYDIVLMDIEMPGRDGLETARALRRMDSEVILIFVTALAQYAVQGYDVDAMGYIVKPVSRSELAIKLRRAIRRASDRSEDALCIKTEDGLVVIRAADVCYVEVTGHYVTYHTPDGEIQEYITLKNAEKKLSKQPFVLCHRCCLVNLRYVTSITKENVWVGKTPLMMAQSRYKPFLQAYSRFIGGV